METKVFKVEGMSCVHCEKAVKDALNGLRGVSHVEVNLAAKTVSVDYDQSAITAAVLGNAIEDQGYEVVK